MNTQTYKIAVIGGGPAGLSAALAAVAAGISDILLIEQKEQWGTPVQCAEYVPSMLGRVIDIPDDAVSASVSRMLFFMDGKPFAGLKAPGFILNRDVMEERLAEKVNAAGVRLEQPARVTHIDERKIVVEATETFEFNADIIIGADGPRSLVRQYIGESLPPFAIGVQDKLPVGPNLEEAEIYVSPKYGAGYAWCFPKKGEANVGIALDRDGATFLRPELSNIIGSLVQEGKIASTASSRTTGGLIPVGAPASTTVKGNVLLVGDAAGQTNPLNGAGIYSAIVCGRMAGEIAAKAIRKNDLTLLEKYEITWRDLFETPLSRALSSRNSLLTCDPEEYASTFKQAWGLKTV